jgi:hypothetical protein
MEALKFLLRMGLVAALSLMGVLMGGCTKEKTIIRYRDFPSEATKISPANGDTLDSRTPTFVWNPVDEAVLYELQLDESTSFFNLLLSVQTTDTSYTTIDSLADDTYYWRVRAKNSDKLWGDWSLTWSFRVMNRPFTLLSQTPTYGYPQELVIIGDRAYIADDEAGLTIMDITDRASPAVLENLNTAPFRDYAVDVYISPDTMYAFLADMDYRIQVFDITEPIDPDSAFIYTIFPHTEVNLHGVTGKSFNDTLYIFASSTYNRKINVAQLNPNDMPWLLGYPFYMELPGFGNDLAIYGDHLYVAQGELGLAIFDLSDLQSVSRTPDAQLDTQGKTLSVFVDGDYAYLADDWEGLSIVDVSNPLNPTLVGNFNTDGRTKDVHVVGNYAFLADGAQGLKVIDVTDKTNPSFVMQYGTEYAYGVFADQDYVYLVDRNLGLMIFTEAGS